VLKTQVKSLLTKKFQGLYSTIEKMQLNYCARGWLSDYSLFKSFVEEHAAKIAFGLLPIPPHITPHYIELSPPLLSRNHIPFFPQGSKETNC